jgi:hypothetical protein
MHTRVWRIRVMTLLAFYLSRYTSTYPYSAHRPGYLSHDRYPEYSSHLDTDSDAA